MRREGFEVCLSRPEVIKKEVDGKMLEPYEDLWLEVPADCLGVVMEQLSSRKAKINDMQPQGSVTVIRAVIPTRGLIGLESGLANTTRGEAVASHSFREYGPNAGDIATRNTGSMISTAQGQATAYALDSIQQRGKLLMNEPSSLLPMTNTWRRRLPMFASANACWTPMRARRPADKKGHSNVRN